MAAQSMLTAEPVDPLVAAEQAVRRYCKWHVAPVVEETLTAPPARGGAIYLPTLRLVELLGVTVSGTALTAEELADVEWDEHGVLRRPGGWPSRWRSVTVTIRHGHDDSSDVAQLIRDIAGRAAAAPVGVSAVVVGSRQTRYVAGAGALRLFPEEREQLAPFRIEGLA